MTSAAAASARTPRGRRTTQLSRQATRRLTQMNAATVPATRARNPLLASTNLLKTSPCPTSSNQSASGTVRTAAYAIRSGTPSTTTATVARPRGRRNAGLRSTRGSSPTSSSASTSGSWYDASRGATGAGSGAAGGTVSGTTTG